MGMKIDLKKIGDSTGLILPKDLLARLNLAQGDCLYVTELPDRSVRLTPYDPPYDPEDAEALDLARALFVEYRDTFEKLAE